MKISSITITNFKGIGNVTLSPDHINVFLGKNGSGKSAALSAITFILTGKVNPEFIKSGEEVLSVSMEFEDGTVIERSRSIKDGNGSGIFRNRNEKMWKQSFHIVSVPGSQ